MRRYYTIEIKKNGNKYYIIWYSDDLDGVVVENGNVVVFKNIIDLEQYYSKNSIYPDKIIASYNFDLLEKVLIGNFKNLDFKIILDLWNLSSDIAGSIKYNFIGDKEDDIVNIVYDKIFCGNNLDTVNTSGKFYVPVFNKGETICLNSIISDMQNLVESKIVKLF